MGCIDVTGPVEARKRLPLDANQCHCWAPLASDMARARSSPGVSSASLPLSIDQSARLCLYSDARACLVLLRASHHWPVMSGNLIDHIVVNYIDTGGPTVNCFPIMY